MGTCWSAKAKPRSPDEVELSPKPEAQVPDIQIRKSSTDETDDFRQRSTSEPTEKLKKKQSCSVSGSDAGYEGSMSRSSSLPHDHSQVKFNMQEQLPRKKTPESSASESSVSYHTAPSPTRVLDKSEEDLRKEVAHYKEENHQLKKKLADLEKQLEELLENQRKTNSKTPSGTAVSDKVVLTLSRRISKWKFLARDLKLEDHEIDKIVEGFPQDVEEQCYQMLKKWKQMNGNNADRATLGEALKKNFGDQLYSEFLTT